MSLIGTRPPTVDEWEKYELHHRARLAIKPGLTGMWQVSGRSEITDFEEVVKLDTKYISEWSFLLDIRILFKTVLIVLGQKNRFCFGRIAPEVINIGRTEPFRIDTCHMLHDTLSRSRSHTALQQHTGCMGGTELSRAAELLLLFRIIQR